MLEIACRGFGGAAVVGANADVASVRRPPRVVKGFRSPWPFKTPTYAADLCRHSITKAAETAFGDDGSRPQRMDMGPDLRLLHDHVLLSLEDAGFCEKGQGMEFVATTT